MNNKTKIFSKSFWWNAPAYFDRWRVFPRIFISVYLYLLYEVVLWFMTLSAPNFEQSTLVSTLIGTGAAWFGLYLREPPKDIQTTDPDKNTNIKEENTSNNIPRLREDDD
jgi:hypothetical protein